MKRSGSSAGGRALFSWLTSRLAPAAFLAALAVIAAPGAKADVVETFNLSGSLGGPPFGPSVPFQGTFDVDFSDDFTSFIPESVDITVNGRSVFNLGLSVSVGFIGASNSVGDSLALWFATPQSGTWVGFDAGEISFSYLVFGDVTGSLFGGSGLVTRDPSDAPITDPPPPITDPPDPPTLAVPELSTWAMLLLGLAGLGLAAKRRRKLGLLGGKG